MHSVKALPVLVALGAQIALAQNNKACTTATYTITDAAQATNIPCRTMEGSIEISEDIGGQLTIDGPSTIKGDLILKNVTQLVSLSSTSLAAIEGKFQLESLTNLNSVNMPSLATIGEIEWLHLPAIGDLRLGQSGVTSASKVLISDTFLSSLDNLKLATVDTMIINNNDRLVSYSTQLSNISSKLEIQSNGDDLEITLANLIWAADIDIRNAASIEMPSLEYINNSLRFDQNTFTSFAAPNLTEIGDGDLSFANNTALTNLSFPLLEKIGGGFTILNNVELLKIDQFPKLEQIDGAVRMGGNFTEVEFPKLDNVVGTFTILSTDEKLADSCKVFEDMDGGKIQGRVSCVPGEEEANEGNFDDADRTSGGSGGSSNKDDDEGAGNMVSTNLLAMLAVAVVGALAQL